MSEIKYLDLAGLTEFKEELDRVRLSDNLNITEALNDISSSIGNGTLTIKKNSVSQGTFTANLKTNTDINISVPTNITDLGQTAITEIQNLIRYGQLDVSGLTNELKLALHESIASTYDYLSEANVEDKLEAYGKIIHYDSSTLKIQLKNGDTVLSEFSAADFISDGMVEDVRITSGTGDNVGKTVLLIDFNTDSGITDIEIPLEDIFDASNYYTKTEVDNLLPDTLTQSEVNTGTDTTGKLVSAKIIRDSIDNAIYGGGGSSGTVITTTNLSTEGISAGFAKTVQVGTNTPVGIDSNGNIPIPAYPTTLPASDVSSWAKQSTKPSYDLDEVADGTTRKIPTKVSDLTNDAGFTTNAGTVTGIKVGTAEAINPVNGVVTIPAYPTTLPASDVSSWAKAATKPSYNYSEINNPPTLGTAAAKDVPTTGNASATQVVMGNDSRLSDSRTPKSHAHGNISNDGTLTDTAAAAAGNDYVVIRNASDSKVQTSTIKGVDVADAISKKHEHSNITLSTSALAYDGTHTIAMPSSDPYTSARTPASHTHGNITNSGTLSDTAAAASGNDYLVIRDADDNKILTSTIKGTEVKDAVDKKHSHSNKSVLDGIDLAKVTAWDNAVSGGLTNVAYDGTYKKITKTIGTTTSDVVAVSTLKTDMGLTKSDVGLSNVTNDSQVKRSEMGVASGVATLDSNCKVPSSQLPSYVDDVIDLLNVTGTAPSTCAKGDKYYNTSSNKIFTASAANTWGTTGETPEAGKIYINLANNKTYRWSGTTLAVISETLALGETETTAYRGDRGKIAYNHSLSTHARTDANKADISYDTTNKKITKTINGTASDVVTASTLVTDGGGLKSHASRKLTVTNGTATAVTQGTEITYVESVSGSSSGSTGDISASTTRKKITVPTIPEAATLSVSGLMSSEDKTKLDGIATGATKVESSSNGKIKINGTDTTVYTLPASDPYTSARTPSSHTHGNIQNGGTLLTTDITIASGDKLVVTDSSDSNKVARTSVSFDGSTTTTALTPKGTFESFSKFSGSYNDLTNKPTIPAAANNGTFSVKTKVGDNDAVTAADFTANQSSADDITFIQGSNVTLTTDTTNRTVIIAAKDTTYSDATTSAAGLMSAADKTKLNGIATGATANTGTITGITMNGTSKGTSGVVDLGNIITSSDVVSTSAPGIVPSTTAAVKYLQTNAQGIASWGNLPSYGYGDISYLSNTASDYTIANSNTTLSVNGTLPLQVVTTTVNIAGITFSALPADGHSCHLIITAASALTVDIAHDATMITVSGTAYKTVCPKAAAIDTLNITAGGYVELDLLRVGTKIYVRGI